MPNRITNETPKPPEENTIFRWNLATGGAACRLAKRPSRGYCPAPGARRSRGQRARGPGKVTGRAPDESAGAAPSTPVGALRGASPTTAASAVFAPRWYIYRCGSGGGLISWQRARSSRRLSAPTEERECSDTPETRKSPRLGKIRN